MHIVLLNDDSLPTGHGGAAVIVDNLQRALSDKGHKVTLVTTHQDASREPIEWSEERVSIFAEYPLKKRHRMCLGYPAMREALETVFAKLQPDVVHAHNVHTYLTYESLLVAKKYTDKIFFTAHDVFLVGFGRVRGARYENAVLHNAPFKLSVVDHLRSVGRKYWPLRNGRIRKILKDSNAQVISLSTAQAKFLLSHGIHSQTIPNGIDSWEEPSAQEIASFREKHGITGPSVLFVGRVREDKGIHQLLVAMNLVHKEIPEAQIVICGDAPPTTNYQPPAPISTGWLNREQTRLSYHSTDIVAVPSICLDVFPTVNLEAGAAGKPVVGTIFGGTPEVVLDGETGYVLNPHIIDDLAKKITSLLKDSTLRERMGTAARQRIEEHFSLEKQANAYLDLYSNIP